MNDIQAYLQQYYSDMNEENKAIINFLEFVPYKASTALDFSYGGSLMIAAQLSKTVKQIDLTDIEERMLQPALQFRKGRGFNWMPVFAKIGMTPLQLASTLGSLYVARFPVSLPKTYDVITCFFALETASTNWLTFQLYYTSLLQHLNPNGWLIIGLVTEQYDEILGTNEEKPLYITSDLFLQYIKPDIFQKIPACADWGYKGMLFSAQQQTRHV